LEVLQNQDKLLPLLEFHPFHTLNAISMFTEFCGVANEKVCLANGTPKHLGIFLSLPIHGNNFVWMWTHAYPLAADVDEAAPESFPASVVAARDQQFGQLFALRWRQAFHKFRCFLFRVANTLRRRTAVNPSKLRSHYIDLPSHFAGPLPLEFSHAWPCTLHNAFSTKSAATFRI
jgi:hypothetical protein